MFSSIYQEFIFLALSQNVKIEIFFSFCLSRVHSPSVITDPLSTVQMTVQSQTHCTSNIPICMELQVRQDPMKLYWNRKPPITQPCHSWHHVLLQHIIHVCGSAKVNKSNMLPVKENQSTFNYIWCITLDNDNKRLTGLWIYCAIFYNYRTSLQNKEKCPVRQHVLL